MTSRRLVLVGAASAALGLAQARRTRAAVADPFSLGVASGEPSPDGFVIWTRLAPAPDAPDGAGGMQGPADLRWEVAEDEAMRRIVRRGQLVVDGSFAHSAHVEVTGLAPDRPYFYRFLAMGEQSPIGRSRTTPALGARPQRLRVAAASCAHWETGWFSAYRHMAAEAPDLVLFLGDYIYEYSYAASREGLVRRHPTPREVTNLAGYRNRYALYRTDGDLRALHAAAPCLMTWDDHEVQNDYAADFSQIGTVPAEEFAARRAAAYQAFYEHMPLRRRSMPRAGAVRLYDRFQFGQLVEIAMLDGRQHRSLQPCARGNSRRGYVAPQTCADLTDPSRSMLGREQEDWLYGGFRQSRAAWNLIGQQQLVAPYEQRTTDGAPGSFTDGWAAHVANRDRMLRAVQESRLSNPVFLGGDMHAFMTSDLKADFRDPSSATIATEFVGSSITSDPTPDSYAASMSLNPHVRLFANKPRGYMAFDVTPERLEMRYRAICDRTDPRASVSTLKTYVVENGRPGAVEA